MTNERPRSAREYADGSTDGFKVKGGGRIRSDAAAPLVGVLLSWLLARASGSGECGRRLASGDRDGVSGEPLEPDRREPPSPSEPLE
jgi:hypothetical protein